MNGGAEMDGTAWTDDGHGDNLATLMRAFGQKVKDGDESRATNLRLTGLALTDRDYWRLYNATVGQIGSFRMEGQK